jgi:hypothetical protein
MSVQQDTEKVNARRVSKPSRKLQETYEDEDTLFKSIRNSGPVAPKIWPIGELLLLDPQVGLDSFQVHRAHNAQKCTYTDELALNQSNLLEEKSCELQLLKDRMSLKSYNLKTMLEPRDLAQLADTQYVNLKDELAVDKDDSFAMRYYLALLNVYSLVLLQERKFTASSIV